MLPSHDEHRRRQRDILDAVLGVLRTSSDVIGVTASGSLARGKNDAFSDLECPSLLKDAPILLLDEPTSALDLRTEADFLDGLEALMAGRTVFIVAHRLSTIRNVDRIYVLKDGTIAEQGCHADLMAGRGDYYKLYSSQFSRDGSPADVLGSATPEG